MFPDKKSKNGVPAKFLKELGKFIQGKYDE